MIHKVLLADDSATIQKLVEMALSDSGFELLSVSDGEQAVQQMADFSPDIILADAIMPKLDGYQVCEYVRDNADFSNVPVILLTGRFQPFDKDRADRVGISEKVVKPFSQDQLVSVMKELLAKVPAPTEVPTPTEMPAPDPVEDEASASLFDEGATVAISPENLRAHLQSLEEITQTDEEEMPTIDDFDLGDDSLSLDEDDVAEVAAPEPQEPPMELHTEDLDDVELEELEDDGFPDTDSLQELDFDSSGADALDNEDIEDLSLEDSAGDLEPVEMEELSFDDTDETSADNDGLSALDEDTAPIDGGFQPDAVDLDELTFEDDSPVELGSDIDFDEDSLGDDTLEELGDEELELDDVSLSDDDLSSPISADDTLPSLEAGEEEPSLYEKDTVPFSEHEDTQPIPMSVGAEDSEPVAEVLEPESSDEDVAELELELDDDSDFDAMVEMDEDSVLEIEDGDDSLIADDYGDDLAETLSLDESNAAEPVPEATDRDTQAMDGAEVAAAHEAFDADTIRTDQPFSPPLPEAEAVEDEDEADASFENLDFADEVDTVDEPEADALPEITPEPEPTPALDAFEPEPEETEPEPEEHEPEPEGSEPEPQFAVEEEPELTMAVEPEPELVKEEEPEPKLFSVPPDELTLDESTDEVVDDSETIRVDEPLLAPEETAYFADTVRSDQPLATREEVAAISADEPSHEEPVEPVVVAEAGAGGGPIVMNDEQMEQLAEKVAKRLIKHLGTEEIRDIVWQVVPELAEAMIKKRIYQLEQSVDTE